MDDCASPEHPKSSHSFAETSAIVCRARSRFFGDEGGEKVGEGDVGVGGITVSLQTLWVASVSPSAAALDSRSSSAAKFASACSGVSSGLCRFGEEGGENCGEGDLGVRGRDLSSSFDDCAIEWMSKLETTELISLHESGYYSLDSCIMAPV